MNNNIDVEVKVNIPDLQDGPLGTIKIVYNSESGTYNLIDLNANQIKSLNIALTRLANVRENSRRHAQIKKDQSESKDKNRRKKNKIPEVRLSPKISIVGSVSVVQLTHTDKINVPDLRL